ncbi:MAG: (2Fe-2S)-binding protein [Gemmatimonadota bacterium]|nr:MAG: (2Fe-2S)-binding protein [Gemmatimonadota bacterium]
MAHDRRDHDEKAADTSGISRRGFISRVGAGAAVVAVASKASAESAKPTETMQATELSRITLTVNGQQRQVLVEPRWTLSHVLREELGLTGTKVGCERGECGACTVLIDGKPRYSCMTLAVEAQDADIVTVEGLMDGEDLGPTQEAFVEKDAFQCGYCTSGQILAVEGMLGDNPNPSLDEIRIGVSGNLCRCGAYVHIFQAAQRAAELKQGVGGES